MPTAPTASTTLAAPTARAHDGRGGREGRASAKSILPCPCIGVPAARSPVTPLGQRGAGAMRAIWRRALDLVFPPRCAACAARGYLLCPACAATIPYIQPPTCPMCGRHTARPGICPYCRAYPNALDGMVAAAAFAGPVRECIHALKYEGQRPYAATLAAIARPAFAALPQPDGLVPVPLSPRRERGRGFNQSALIARHLAGDAMPVASEWLARTRDTPPQVGQDRAARHANVAGAFLCPDPAAVRGRRVLLLDDVATTGATLDACARALRAAGAASVHALVVARAE